MMNSKELRQKAWLSLKGKYWLAFGAYLLISLICSIGLDFSSLASGIFDLEKTLSSDASLAKEVEEVGVGLVVGIIAFIGVIFFIAHILVTNAMYVGCARFFITNTTTGPALSEIFAGFKSGYGKNIKTMVLADIKLLLWTLLFLVPGIIKACEYSMIPYILADNPGITSKEAFAKAKAMMNGNKWRYVKLNISFIWWILLAVLTLGIGIFFLAPYIEAANAEFYKELTSKKA